MNSYEIMFLFSEKENPDEAVETIKNLIKSINHESLEVSDLGSKKLAYEIKKQTMGHYYLATFQAETLVIPELNRVISIQKNIMRYIIINKDKNYGARVLKNAKKMEVAKKKNEHFQKLANMSEEEKNLKHMNAFSKPTKFAKKVPSIVVKKKEEYKRIAVFGSKADASKVVDPSIFSDKHIEKIKNVEIAKSPISHSEPVSNVNKLIKSTETELTVKPKVTKIGKSDVRKTSDEIIIDKPTKIKEVKKITKSKSGAVEVDKSIKSIKTKSVKPKINKSKSDKSKSDKSIDKKPIKKSTILKPTSIKGVKKDVVKSVKSTKAKQAKNEIKKIDVAKAAKPIAIKPTKNKDVKKDAIKKSSGHAEPLSRTVGIKKLSVKKQTKSAVTKPTKTKDVDKKPSRLKSVAVNIAKPDAKKSTKPAAVKPTKTKDVDKKPSRLKSVAVNIDKLDAKKSTKPAAVKPTKTKDVKDKENLKSKTSSAKNILRDVSGISSTKKSVTKKPKSSVTIKTDNLVKSDKVKSTKLKIDKKTKPDKSKKVDAPKKVVKKSIKSKTKK